MITWLKKDSRWIPALFVVFFTVFVFIKVPIVIYLGNKSWTGLVTEQPYEDGLKYNQILARQKQQDALGWHHDIEWQAISGQRQTGVVTLTLTDHQNQPLHNMHVTIHAVRPDKIVSEQTATMISEGDRYIAHISLPLSGRWDMMITAKGPDNREYRANHTVVVQ